MTSPAPFFEPIQPRLLRAEELAKQCNVEFEDVRGAAAIVGIRVRDLTSPISPTEADRLRRELQRISAHQAETSFTADRDRLGRLGRQRQRRPAGGKGPGTPVDQVFANDAEALAMARRLRLHFVVEKKDKRQPLTGTAAFLQRHSPNLSDRQARNLALQWANQIMPEDEVAAWLAAGISIDGHATAATLSASGVRPAHLAAITRAHLLRLLDESADGAELALLLDRIGVPWIVNEDVDRG